MASDEEDDIEALRLAALATLRKKPAVIEAQPIPQLTSSGHSIHNSKSNSSWNDDFPYNDVPFESAHAFPDSGWSHQPQHTAVPVSVSIPPPSVPHQYGQGTPTHFAHNWRGRGAPGDFQRPFARGRAPFPRARFGHTQRFGSQMQFNRNNPRAHGFSQPQRGPFNPNQRPPFNPNQRPPFNPNQRPPFNPNQRPPFNPNQRPPFNQPPSQFPPGGPVPPVSTAGGGLGNLIVISTVPEEEPQHPVESSRLAPSKPVSSLQSKPVAKPVLLLPQDKYCSTSVPVQSVAETEPEHRKKKDKFSRFDSSGSESDDEDESEQESDDDRRSRRLSFRSSRDKEANDHTASELDTSVPADETNADIPDVDISIPAMDTSNVDSDKELDDLEEPVVENFDDASETKEEAPAEEEEDDEMDEEEEARLLADSPQPGDVDVESVQSDTRVTPADSTHNSVERNGSTARAVKAVTTDNVKKGEPPAKRAKHRGEGTDSEKESGDSSSDESDTSSHSSSSSSSSSSNSDSEGGSDSSDSDDDQADGENMDVEESPEQADSRIETQGVEAASDSDNEAEQDSVRRRPAPKSKTSNSPPRKAASPTPKKSEPILTPQEKARLEARKRKFESGKEVQVAAGNKRTISLKGIVPKNKKSRSENSHSSSQPAASVAKSKSSSSSKSDIRTVETKTPPKTRRPSGSDSHRKHRRRKVSIEVDESKAGQSDSNDDANAKSESEEEEDDEGGSRSWRREANTNATRRKTTVAVDRALPDTDSGFRGNYRGGAFNRNGGYNRRGGYDRHRDNREVRRNVREDHRDQRPEVHYSSDDDDDSGDRTKMISVVVQRTASAPRSASDQPRGRQDGKHKRTVSGVETGSKRPAQTHNRNISVVISGDSASQGPSRSGGSRMSARHRLGGKQAKSEAASSTSKSHSAKSLTPSDDEESKETVPSELEERMQQIKRKNLAIMRRQEEIRRDRELFG